MERLSDPAACRLRTEGWRREGRRIAFVPTMGFLHEGHLALLRAARSRGDVLVLSIYVNPTQFGPTEDLARYPRDLEGDLAKAAGCGVDLAFVPDSLYPPGAQTFVEVTELSRSLCGVSRPGHFRGVATVVTMLFQIVQPDVALFGEKDYQQLLVIRRLVRDLHLGTEVVGHPIVREPDGLALSSRNAYLSPEERERARSLSRALEAARRRVSDGERSAERIVAAARGELGACRIEYIALVHPETLAPIDRLEPGTAARLLIAAFVGSTRLIDNTHLSG